jgi:hypothetical protein
MSNKEVIRKAFDQVCSAMEQLDHAKVQLADLHYRAEKVEDTGIVLNRVSETVEPSSDSHEFVFIQHERAKDDLREALASSAKASIANRLGVAYSATSDAFSVLKQI